MSNQITTPATYVLIPWKFEGDDYVTNAYIHKSIKVQEGINTISEYGFSYTPDIALGAFVYKGWCFYATQEEGAIKYHIDYVQEVYHADSLEGIEAIIDKLQAEANGEGDTNEITVEMVDQMLSSEGFSDTVRQNAKNADTVEDLLSYIRFDIDELTRAEKAIEEYLENIRLTDES